MDEKGCIPLEWPSKRIPQGGIFHNHKVKYTPETIDLMKVLMEESKLTLLQRKQLDWCLRSGSSLSEIKRDEYRGRSAASSVQMVRPRTSRRRSYSAIIGSGDFERERYRPNQRNEDREIVKHRLQEIMEFGRNLGVQGYNNTVLKNSQKQTPSQSRQLPSKKDLMHDILSQIKERMEWLEEMEVLGEGAKHRDVIRHQIAERFRKLEALKLSNEEFETFTGSDNNTLNVNKIKTSDEIVKKSQNGKERINSSTNNPETLPHTGIIKVVESQREVTTDDEKITKRSPVNEQSDKIFQRTFSTHSSTKSFDKYSRNSNRNSQFPRKDNDSRPGSKVSINNYVKNKPQRKDENIAEISLTCSSCLSADRPQRSTRKKSVK